MTSEPAGPPQPELAELANDLRLACQIIARRVRFESAGDIPPHQISVLFAVRKASQTPTALAERERVSTPAMTRTLNVLEQRGLVRRQPNAEDSRSVLVSLTDQGRAVIGQVLDSRDTWMMQHLAGLPAEELAILAGAAGVLTRIGRA